MSLEAVIAENTRAIIALTELVNASLAQREVACNTRSDTLGSPPSVDASSDAEAATVHGDEVVVEPTPAPVQESGDLKKQASKLCNQMSAKGMRDRVFEIIKGLGYETFQEVTDYQALIDACQKELS